MARKKPRPGAKGWDSTGREPKGRDSKGRDSKNRGNQPTAGGPPRHNPFKDLEDRLRPLAEVKSHAPPDPRVSVAGPVVAETPSATPSTTASATASATARETASATARETASEPGDLFAAAMADVQPLPVKAPHLSGPRRQRSVSSARGATVSEAAEVANFALLLDTMSRPSWAADPGDPALLDLERGLWTPDAELDLHGYHADAARRRLRSFLGEARQRRWRCVRIVHGQGLHSDGDPVLRGACRKALQRRPAEVQAWCEALPAGGGSGATLVLVRKA